MQRKDIEHTASLLKFRIEESKIEDYQSYISDKISIIEELLSVDTEGVEPTVRLTNRENVFREDIVQPSYPREKLLANAAEHNEAAYIVPKIVE